MSKIEVTFDKVVPKKNSIRYDSSEHEPAMKSIYISNKGVALLSMDTKAIPRKIKVTIEVVE